MAVRCASHGPTQCWQQTSAMLLSMSLIDLHSVQLSAASNPPCMMPGSIRRHVQRTCVVSSRHTGSAVFIPPVGRAVMHQWRSFFNFPQRSLGGL
jgi:hypothetical protein